MCGPAALALGAAALSAAGTMTAAVSSAQQSRYQAKIADRNAALANEQGRDAQERGRIEALQRGRQLGQAKGAQQAAQAANGLDTSFGSALDLAQDTAMIGAEDASAASFNLSNDIRGFDISASNYKAEASAKRSAAKGAIIGGAFGAASTMLGGVQQFGGIKARAGASPGG